jgi:flagellar biosynthesis protein FlhF
VFKNLSVGVITTDTVCAGGVDQLAAFTRLLKVKLTTVEDPDALASAYQVHRDADLVIVDTAGRNPYDEGEMDDLKDLLAVTDAEPILLLPAGMDAFEASDTAAAFKALGVRRLIATRLDIARRLGSLLVAAYRNRLAFCEAGISAKVADGLTPLNPVALARIMIPGYEKPARVATSRRPEPAPAPAARSARTPSSRTFS